MILLGSILAATAATATVNMIMNHFKSKSHKVLMLKLDILDDETEEEDTDVLLVAVAATRAASKVKRRRRPPLHQKRLDWKMHVKRLKWEGQFQQMYQMQYKSFCKLLSLASPALQVDSLQGL
jgi:hypothetical protein